MRNDWISTTNSTYSDYNRFNRYYNINVFGESSPSLKVKTIKKESPKKEEVHIFDIKDLDLKEVL